MRYSLLIRPKLVKTALIREYVIRRRGQTLNKKKVLLTCRLVYRETRKLVSLSSKLHFQAGKAIFTATLMHNSAEIVSSTCLDIKNMLAPGNTAYFCLCF